MLYPIMCDLYSAFTRLKAEGNPKADWAKLVIDFVFDRVCFSLLHHRYYFIRAPFLTSYIPHYIFYKRHDNCSIKCIIPIDLHSPLVYIYVYNYTTHMLFFILNNTY